MSAPDSSTAPADQDDGFVPVDRFPNTVAWPQVTFIALVMAATLLPLMVALVLAL